MLRFNCLARLVPHSRSGAQLSFRKQTRIETVVEVVAVVSDFISQIGHLGFQRWRGKIALVGLFRTIISRLVFSEPFADLPGKVEARESRVVLLQFLDDSQALPVVFKPTLLPHQSVQYRFAFMAERRVAQVVSQGDGLRQVLVELKGSGDIT